MPSSVDWRSLWEEFGFGTPDANGNLGTTETKLVEAVRLSGDVRSARSEVQRAIDDGPLVQGTTALPGGEETDGRVYLEGDA